MISIGDTVYVHHCYTMYVVQDIRSVTNGDNIIYEYYIIPLYGVGMSSDYKWMREEEFIIGNTVQESRQYLEECVRKTEEKYRELQKI